MGFTKTRAIAQQITSLLQMRDVQARNQAICRDHKAGERLGLLVRRYGLTEKQIFKILGL